jgi:hypothetical protein
MTIVMAYQYPPLPSSRAEFDNQSQIMGAYHLPPVTGQDQNPPISNDYSVRDSPTQSATSKSGKIKRSSSTPNIGGQMAADALAASAEKRRNKLGYHRTSVACGW